MHLASTTHNVQILRDGVSTTDYVKTLHRLGGAVVYSWKQICRVHGLMEVVAVRVGGQDTRRMVLTPPRTEREYHPDRSILEGENVQ